MRWADPWVADLPELPVPFGDDALAYFTERLDPEVTRVALASTLQQAKRNKAFESSRFIGLAIDGTGAGCTHKLPCPLCHPVKDEQGLVQGYLHHLAMIVVGTGLTLPLDVEPYGPGDSEYGAGKRLLDRSVTHLGPALPITWWRTASLPELHSCIGPRIWACRWWSA